MFIPCLCVSRRFLLDQVDWPSTVLFLLLNCSVTTTSCVLTLCVRKLFGGSYSLHAIDTRGGKNLIEGHCRCWHFTSYCNLPPILMFINSATNNVCLEGCSRIFGFNRSAIEHIQGLKRLTLIMYIS